VKRVRNKRIELWAHLVSEHAAIININFTFEDLKDIHDHEHNHPLQERGHRGPGTIRNHPKELRNYSVKQLGKVLSESED
jgi:hypothetical protein